MSCPPVPLNCFSQALAQGGPWRPTQRVFRKTGIGCSLWFKTPVRYCSEFRPRAIANKLRNLLDYLADWNQHSRAKIKRHCLQARRERGPLQSIDDIVNVDPIHQAASAAQFWTLATQQRQDRIRNQLLNITLSGTVCHEDPWNDHL